MIGVLYHISSSLITVEPLSVRKLHFADGVKKKATQGPAMQRGNEAGQDAEEDSSETSSESSSDEEEAEARDGVSKTSNSGGAPVELKGEVQLLGSFAVFVFFFFFLFFLGGGGGGQR